MNDKIIGFFIKKLREEKKMTQDDLALKMNIDRSVIAKIEAGRRTPTTEQLNMLKNIFNVSADELLSGHKKSKELDIEEEIINIYSKGSKLKKYINILLILIIMLLLLFFSYYFISNYNKTRAYIILNNNKKFYINRSIIFQTPQKLYFEMDFQIDTDKSINQISLYYKKNKESIFVLSNTGNDNRIYFYDYYGYNEYIDFDNLEFFYKTLYLEIEYNDYSKEIIPLTTKKDIDNTKIFFKKDKNIENKQIEDNNTFDSMMYRKVKEKTKDFTRKEELKIKVNNNEYIVTYDETGILISYDQILIKYMFMNKYEILTATNIDNNEEFTYCRMGIIYKENKKYYDLFMEIIDKT